VGHCCESGDLLTTGPGEPDVVAPRAMDAASSGDLLLVGGCGAYCASMSAIHYNSFPQACEALVTETGELHIIRNQQPLAQLWQNEVRVATAGHPSKL